MDYTKVFAADFIRIHTGEVTDTNLLVDQWPVDPYFTSATDGKMTPDDAKIAREKLFGGQVKMEKGREVALAHLHQVRGLSGVYASMIHETASGWKFDVPNGISAQILYNDLVNRLDAIDQSQAQWPADVNEAYRHVTQAVILAIYDVNESPTRNAANTLDTGAVRPANTADNR